MDTPERAATSQQQIISTPVSRVEDSPVFNFLNNLSPIKPAKPLCITQTFQSLSSPPISSIFSSPHVSVQKENRFTLRSHLFHLSKSDNVERSQKCSGEFDIPKPLNSATGDDSNEDVDHPANDHGTPNNKLSHPLQYSCGSPNHNTIPFLDANTDTNLDVRSSLLIDYVPYGMEERDDVMKSDLDKKSIPHHDKNHQNSDSEWDTLISENTENPLILDFCTENVATHEYSEILDQDSNHAIIMPKAQVEESSESYLPEVFQDSPVDINKEVEEQNVMSSMQSYSLSDEKLQINSPVEVDFHHQRGIRRRCLLFEMAGANRRNACLEVSKTASAQVSDEKHMNPVQGGACPLPCTMPGIGLHLNSLASTSKDVLFRKENLPSQTGQMSTSCSLVPLTSILQNEKLPQGSSSIDDCQYPGVENHVLVCETSAEPEITKSEELNSNSPKKKKRKLENIHENESCKRCNCKKSKCLKLYCECFAAGVYCVEPCSCQGCFNKPMHEDIVLATRKQIESRNPLAFAPKVIRTSESASEIGHEEANKTPASARHKRGCNCKKSNCLKKYCECFQGGVGCSISCRCEGCKNKFGTKDGKLPMSGEDIEHGNEEIDPCNNEGIKLDNQRKAPINELQNPEITAPITPTFPTLKPCSKLSFPSTGKPPRSTVLVIGSSPRLNAFNALKKFEMTPCHSKTTEHSLASPVDESLETPSILKGNAPVQGTIKVSSPSRKRVSPPHNETTASPNRRGSRKLILRSIPSFPSLISETKNDDPRDLAMELLDPPSME